MADSWGKEVVRTPTTIGLLEIVFKDRDGQAANHSAVYNIDVYDQNGKFMKRMDGNLTPHLSSAQLTTIVSFLASMRTKAEGEILP